MATMILIGPVTDTEPFTLEPPTNQVPFPRLEVTVSFITREIVLLGEYLWEMSVTIDSGGMFVISKQPRVFDTITSLEPQDHAKLNHEPSHNAT